MRKIHLIVVLVFVLVQQLAAVEIASVANECVLATPPVVEVGEVKPIEIGKLNGTISVPQPVQIDFTSTIGSSLKLHTSQSLHSSVGGGALVGVSVGRAHSYGSSLFAGRAMIGDARTLSTGTFISADAFLAGAKSRRENTITEQSTVTGSLQSEGGETVTLDDENSVGGTSDAPISDGVGVLLFFTLMYVLYRRKCVN